MLLSSGIGSFVSRRLTSDPGAAHLRFVLLAVALAVAVLAFVAAPIGRAGVGLPLPEKMLITVLLIAPVGFLMGIPFPTGLTLLESRYPEAVRWAWSLNAAASVMGSAAAIFLAVYLGSAPRSSSAARSTGCAPGRLAARPLAPPRAPARCRRSRLNHTPCRAADMTGSRMQTASPPHELAGACLKQAIAEYGQSSEATRTVKRLATESPEWFCAAAAGLLSGEDDSPGHRYCAVLLSRQPGFLPLLTDSFLLTRRQALNLCRRMLRIDPGFLARLIRCLPGRDGATEERHLPAGACERALDLLDSLCPGAMLASVIYHLASHPDPRISSKATLLIGKRIQDGHWAGQQWQSQEDARVRANTIESIWGIDSPECRSLLWSVAEEDQNCRVAGNAWFGLHLLHEPCVDAKLAAMARSEKPEFRRTAAWAMGKIGGPSCVAALTGLVKDDNPRVRGIALRSLVGLSKQQNQ